MGSRRLKRFIILIAVLFIVFYGMNKLYPEEKARISRITGYIAMPKFAEETKEPIVLFCPRGSCGLNLEFMINSSNTVHCAFFDLDLENVIAALQRKDALVVVDADNFEKGRMNSTKFSNFRKDNRKAFMHNKFCIFDNNIIWTGSFNPTHNCDEKNNNNAVIIYSKSLAGNYEDEFQELWNGNFGKGGKVKIPEIRIGNITVKNYFCPEDFCANEVMEELSRAEKSIYFMTFSFTHDRIGDILVKKHDEGIDVKGVFEKRQKSQYSESQKLNQSGIKVKLDTNPATMHHKVFIIDNRTVITGSFNPTMNGDKDNDENILIIEDGKIAAEFIEEFRLVYG